MPRELDFADGFESSVEPTRPSDSQAITNNQVAAADVTGLLFDSTIRHAWALVSLYRKDSLQEKAASGIIHVQQKFGGVWSVEPESEFDTFVTTGVTFSIVAGQVKYVSTNFVGTGYTSAVKTTLLHSFTT